jgi:hypothetical protein
LPAINISGTVFDDLDADGLFTLGEPTLSGITVYLDANNNGVLNAGETYTTSSAGGAYSFSSLAAGTYVVREHGLVNYASMNVLTISSSTTDANVANQRIVYTGASFGDNYLLRKNGSGKFELYIGGSLTYTLSSTIPSLTFNLGNGSDILTLDCAGGTPIPTGGITFDGGDDSDSLVLLGAASTSSDTFASQSITFHGGGIAHTNLENISLDTQGGSDSVTINGGPRLTLPTSQQLQSLTIASGASAAITAGAGSLFCNTLSIASGGALDLADNDLVVNIGDFATIQALVLNGFGNTAGIISSTSDGSQILALFDNSLVGASEWNGAPIGTNAIVGKYTFFGDMNLDGQVTGDDYTVIDANLSTTPLAGFAWLAGDANLDGDVTGDDYTVIDANLGLGAGNPLSPLRLREDDLLLT